MSEEHQEHGPAGAACEMCEVAVPMLLMMFTSLRMELGFDPDGSDTMSRAEGVLGQFGRIAVAIGERPAAFDPNKADARDRLLRLLRNHGPVVSRIARPEGAV